MPFCDPIRHCILTPQHLLTNLEDTPNNLGSFDRSSLFYSIRTSKKADAQHRCHR